MKTRLFAASVALLLLAFLAGCGEDKKPAPLPAAPAPRPAPAFDWEHPIKSSRAIAEAKVAEARESLDLAAADVKRQVREAILEALWTAKLWGLYVWVVLPTACILLLALVVSYFRSAVPRRVLAREWPDGGKEYRMYTPSSDKLWGHVAALGVWALLLALATWLMIF